MFLFCRRVWGSLRAFSLLELLVVMFIITLLMVLLFPALGRVKARGKSMVCLNNLRQWGVATHLFAAENDDFLPKDGAPNGTSSREGWYVDLPRMMGLPAYDQMPWRTNATVDPGRSVWICPANSRRSNGRNLFHYCLNQHVNRKGAGNQIPITAIRRTDAVVWLFDNGKLAGVAQQNNVHSNLHQGGAQFLFVDGHAARFGAADYWDPKTGRGRTNHPSLIWVP